MTLPNLKGYRIGGGEDGEQMAVQNTENNSQTFLPSKSQNLAASPSPQEASTPPVTEIQQEKSIQQQNDVNQPASSKVPTSSQLNINLNSQNTQNESSNESIPSINLKTSSNILLLQQEYLNQFNAKRARIDLCKILSRKAITENLMNHGVTSSQPQNASASSSITNNPSVDVLSEKQPMEIDSVESTKVDDPNLASSQVSNSSSDVTMSDRTISGKDDLPQMQQEQSGTSSEKQQEAPVQQAATTTTKPVSLAPSDGISSFGLCMFSDGQISEVISAEEVFESVLLDSKFFLSEFPEIQEKCTSYLQKNSEDLTNMFDNIETKSKDPANPSPTKSIADVKQWLLENPLLSSLIDLERTFFKSEASSSKSSREIVVEQDISDVTPSTPPTLMDMSPAEIQASLFGKSDQDKKEEIGQFMEKLIVLQEQFKTEIAFFKQLEEQWVQVYDSMIAEHSKFRFVSEEEKSFSKKKISAKFDCLVQLLKKKYINQVFVIQESIFRSKKRGNLPKTATSLLKNWLFQHFLHPYPTEEEKRDLSAKSGLSLTQINNWFINARVRTWRPMLESMLRGETQGGKFDIPQQVLSEMLKQVQQQSSGNSTTTQQTNQSAVTGNLQVSQPSATTTTTTTSINPTSSSNSQQNALSQRIASTPRGMIVTPEQQMIIASQIGAAANSLPQQSQKPHENSNQSADGNNSSQINPQTVSTLLSQAVSSHPTATTSTAGNHENFAQHTRISEQILMQGLMHLNDINENQNLSVGDLNTNAFSEFQ